MKRPERLYVFAENGAVLAGLYSSSDEADARAERERRAGRFAFVGTMDEWNAWNPRWSVVG